MTGRLTVLTGTRAGEVRTLGEGLLTLGRDSRSTLQFDPVADVDVSARHAELRIAEGIAIVRDCNSTNGTYVNGVRVRGELALRDGDVLQLGARGPKVEFRGEAAPAVNIASTTQRVAVAVRQQTRGLRAALGIAAGVAIVAIVGALWASRGQTDRNSGELEMLRSRNDSLGAALGRDMQAMSGRIAGLDSALAAAQRESERLRRQLDQARGDAGLRPLSAQLSEAESRRGALLAAGQVDYAAILAASGKAVVMIAVEMPDGRMLSGSGFNLAAEGRIVTNRHLVDAGGSAQPARIAVIFADTRDWIEARVDRAAGDADLAILRLTGGGPYPAVSSVDAQPPTVGEPIAIVGFPLGMGTPMDGDDDTVTVRTTVGIGAVAKVLPRVLQIEAFATEGSSGSPVFGRKGNLLGVVFGGASGAQGRIVYAVPASTVLALAR